MPLEVLQNGRYRRLRLLGSGGMGEVYLMEDTRINRQVAIKVVRTEAGHSTDRDAARLFQREAHAIAALEHPNILPFYDYETEVHNGITLSYLVMALGHQVGHLFLVHWYSLWSIFPTTIVKHLPHSIS